jgi:hypothetical protein
MGDDDHLVGAERPQLVREGGGGARVAHFPTCHELVFACPGQRALEGVRASATSPSMSDTA